MDQCADAMSKSAFTVDRSTYYHSDKSTRTQQLNWGVGQMSNCLMTTFVNPPVYSLTSTSDATDKCPGTVCYVVHLEGNPNGIPVIQDTWVDKTTFHFLTRYKFEHQDGPPDTSIETTEKASSFK